MNYLSAGEYENYGLESTTPVAWAAAASALIEAHCRRPSLGVAAYTERLRMRSDRGLVRLSFLPLATVPPASTALVSVRGRYGYPRRGEGLSGMDEYAWDIARTFGLPGAWSDIDPTTVDYCEDSGELSLPVHPLGLYFNEVEVTYNAGLVTIPDAVKIACAQLVRNALATPALNLKAGTLDRMRLEYFAGTLLDQDVTALLAPWVAQKAG